MTGWGLPFNVCLKLLFSCHHLLFIVGTCDVKWYSLDRKFINRAIGYGQSKCVILFHMVDETHCASKIVVKGEL